MVPGMMCDERIFSPQIEALSQNLEVTIADISNFSSVRELASDVLKKAPKKFSLLGHSMGGIVAMEIYSQAPDRIEKLILMDTNPKAELDEVKLKREPQIREVNKGKLLEVMRDEMKPNYLAESENKRSVLNVCMDMALTLGPDVFINQSRALQSRLDQQNTIQSIKIPVLILCGSEDKLCPVERHEMMHNMITDSDLKIINNAGHMPTLEQPRETTEVIKEWLMR
jgi:pimeloyl-ACP methyl ester carboxylesterase|tara:strand:- start:658 stop:1335 length:678 start_codon:yes stop_codon:yes gene_type:complete